MPASNIQLTKHFNLSEFACHDGSETPPLQRANLAELALELEKLRAYIGKPIRIISGYRSPEHNRAVGGAIHSQHLLGKAADIQVEGMTPSKVRYEVEDGIYRGKFYFGGVGAYDTFTHLDTRKEEARWHG